MLHHPLVKAVLTLFKGIAHSVGSMLGRLPSPAMIAALVVVGVVAPSVAPAQQVADPAANRSDCRLCTTAPTDSDDAPASPLHLEVATRLDFDKVVYAGTGDAQLDLSPTGTARLSGATTASGARAMPGTVTVRGEPGRAVRIDLPRMVELFGDSGHGTIRILSLRTDLPNFPRIGADGTLSFRFGGDLRISGDSDGSYRGSVDILVEYL